MQPLDKLCESMGYKPKDAVAAVLLNHEGTWLPITRTRRITTVEAWLGTPPPGIRWATRIAKDPRTAMNTIQARAEAIPQTRPAPQGRGHRNPRAEDWEEDPYEALKEDAEQHPVIYQDGIPIQAGSEHDPRL